MLPVSLSVVGSFPVEEGEGEGEGPLNPYYRYSEHFRLR